MFLLLYLKFKIKNTKAIYYLKLTFLFILSEIMDISTGIDLFSVKFVFYRDNTDEKLLSETRRLANIWERVFQY